MRILFILGLLFQVACASMAKHPSLQSETLSELIPVRAFAANINFQGHFRISPDGQKLAWKGVHGTQEAVLVQSVQDAVQDNANPKSALLYNVRRFYWMQDSRHILLLIDKMGDENYHLYLVDSENPNNEAKDLTPFDGVRAYLQQRIVGDAQHILVAHNQRDTSAFDLYKINVHNGESTLLQRNEAGDILRWITDDNGNIDGRVRQHGARRVLEIMDSRGSWIPYTEWQVDERHTPLLFSEDNQYVYFLSNKNSDRVVLERHDIVNKSISVIYKAPKADVQHVVFRRTFATPLLAFSYPDYPHVEVLDPEFKEDFHAIMENTPANIMLSNTDNGENKLILRITTDRSERAILYDRGSKTILPLFSGAMNNYSRSLAKVEAVQIDSRDGVSMTAYVTRPNNVRSKHLPAVILVQSSPWWRHYWHYDHLVQLLANRGYLVLQINTRGSSGYGKRYFEASKGEIGAKLQQDLEDGAQWLVDHEYADEAKIAIVGRQYGGYASLMGLIKTPERYACGIDIMGFKDLTKLHETSYPYWKFGTPFLKEYIGDVNDSDQLLEMKSRSPIYNFSKIRKPVLIVQGARDDKSITSTARQLVSGLEAMHRQVHYLEFDDEAKDIRRWPNRLSLYRHIEDFLGDCLGGRTSGFDYYQLGAWLF